MPVPFFGPNGTFVLTPVSVTAATSKYTYVATQTKLPPSSGTGVVANVDAFAPLPFLENTITDSHVYQRDRLGRTVAFMASIAAHSPVDANGQLLSRVKAIAVDQDTALLIETRSRTNGPAAGSSLVVSNSTDPLGHSVRFLESPKTPPTIAATGALVYSGILVHRAVINETVTLPQAWTNLLALETATKSTNPADYLLETFVTSTGTIIKKRFWLGGILVDDVY